MPDQLRKSRLRDSSYVSTTANKCAHVHGQVPARRHSDLPLLKTVLQFQGSPNHIRIRILHSVFTAQHKEIPEILFCRLLMRPLRPLNWACSLVVSSFLSLGVWAPSTATIVTRSEPPHAEKLGHLLE